MKIRNTDTFISLGKAPIRVETNRLIEGTALILLRGLSRRRVLRDLRLTDESNVISIDKISKQLQA